MTISFKCPWCNNLCGFDDRHSGKRARCQKCNRHFIIPSTEGQIACRVEMEASVPIAGFWRAAAMSSFRMFFNRDSITGLVFVAGLVCLRFFIGHTDFSFTLGIFCALIPTGWAAIAISWGLLFWYYMETIQWSAMGYDELPEVVLDGGFSFIWKVVRGLYLFIIALIFAELPFFIIIRLLESAGLETILLSKILVLCGLFIFPMYLLFLSTGKELWMTFRYDYIFKPIILAILPYSVGAALVMSVMAAEWTTVAYGELVGASRAVIGMQLAANIATAYLGLVAMRVIGLFERHYGCYLPGK